MCYKQKQIFMKVQEIVYDLHEDLRDLGEVILHGELTQDNLARGWQTLQYWWLHLVIITKTTNVW